ncbi:hypothetical protein [Paenibacillus silvae]|uniref:hypothetical protein n=1 Tax=Paenibacillus silvae TaxID=1325358 RepID=UPI0011A15437|nr:MULTISPECIES: hypothetical protein [Paenibacillus]MCK6075821.1 hypothetical protein [Paenibacillus silvae]MCK6150210.1 hypothetical protein [Paenibacillus silvae]MCK6268508.1 hypothetical protein [Paenibacillus silvae]
MWNVLGMEYLVKEETLLFTEKVKLDTGHLDMLIHNAAILGSITDPIHGPVNIAGMAEVPNVNTLGSLHVTQASCPSFFKARPS